MIRRPVTERDLQGLARVVDASVSPAKFILLTFSPDQAHGSQVDYVSNCDRADILVALKEIVARFEGQSRQSGRA